jgi:hypothetical protein
MRPRADMKCPPSSVVHAAAAAGLKIRLVDEENGRGKTGAPKSPNHATNDGIETWEKIVKSKIVLISITWADSCQILRQMSRI